VDVVTEEDKAIVVIAGPDVMAFVEVIVEALPPAVEVVDTAALDVIVKDASALVVVAGDEALGVAVGVHIPSLLQQVQGNPIDKAVCQRPKQ
jgi:hypothetical protein